MILSVLRSANNTNNWHESREITKQLFYTGRNFKEIENRLNNYFTEMEGMRKAADAYTLDIVRLKRIIGNEEQERTELRRRERNLIVVGIAELSSVDAELSAEHDAAALQDHLLALGLGESILSPMYGKPGKRGKWERIFQSGKSQEILPKLLEKHGK